MPLDQDPIEDAAGGEKEMSFLDHLEELRWHIVRALSAVVFFTIFAFVSAPWIFENIIFAPAQANFPTFTWLCKFGEFFGQNGLCVETIPFKIQSRQMSGQFSMHIMASFVIGLVISFPYVVWELWRFIRPGLYSRERKYSTGVVASISFLFLSGILFGYYIIAPLMVYFLATYSISDMIVNEFDITSYVSTVVMMVLGTGILFQLPVVIYFLTKMGILSARLLRQYRKHSFIVILIVAAIVTPPDILSQTLITIPLYLLFEVSIVIASRVEKNKMKEEAEELKLEQERQQNN
jgi:sec-independent protein translocase protein TatC